MRKYQVDQHYTTDDGRIFVVTHIKDDGRIKVRFIKGNWIYSFDVGSQFDDRCEVLPFQIGQKYINKKTDSAKDSEPFIVTEIKYGIHDNNEVFVVYQRLESGTHSQFSLTSLFAGKCTPYIDPTVTEKFEVGKVYVNSASAYPHNDEPFIITGFSVDNKWVDYRHLKSGVFSSFMIGSTFANDSVPHGMQQQIYGPGGYEEQIAALQKQLSEEKQAVEREAQLATDMANDRNDAQAEVKRLRKALRLIVDLDDAMGHNLNEDDAFFAVRIACRALANQPLK